MILAPRALVCVYVIVSVPVRVSVCAFVDKSFSLFLVIGAHWIIMANDKGWLNLTYPFAYKQWKPLQFLRE